VVDGLRPVEFGDKIREDIRDFRQYGVSGSGSSSSSELKYGEDTLVSVFSYTLRLVQDADKSRSIGAALVGRSGDILTKRRYGGSVGDLDDLDRKFKMERADGGRGHIREGSSLSNSSSSDKLMPLCPYCGFGDHFPWKCKSCVDTKGRRMVLDEEQWSVYGEALKTSDYGGKIGTFTRFREMCKPEEALAKKNSFADAAQASYLEDIRRAHANANRNGGSGGRYGGRGGYGRRDTGRSRGGYRGDRGGRDRGGEPS
ncbi:hypothetical protein ADUPG1_001520, partial [Aduncisulcus paluster]